MHSNRATIYSNGIADFQRIFPVSGDKTNKISIPVRQQHLGDVLASMTISGKVKIESPPTYQPANQDDGNITISTGNALTELAHQLAGANVAISIGKTIVEGKLVGVQDSQVATAGEPITETSLVVMTPAGFTRLSINEIETLKYVDEAIQSEIDKALNRRLRNIKPNSTFVDLELSTEENSTDAIIQYTIPAAAWKISYRVLIHDNKAIEFHGHAIVDNNTDEDWKDFVISVVMGQPISFTTDLADSKTPRRSHVNIVQESAVGAVEIEEPFTTHYDDGAHGSARFSLGDSAPGGQHHSRDRSAARTLMTRGAAAKRVDAARVDEAEVTETGDFCIFESADPVSIAAQRAAVIPMFATTLDETKPVLYFKTGDHAERPFRALRFKNTTTHSLGRGVCTVYDGTTYAGSCILPATKPGCDALLPHALETAVKTLVKPLETKTRRVGIRINRGVAYQSHHHLSKTEYHIQSSRKEAFEFLLDHENRIHESKCEAQLIRKDEPPIAIDIKSLKHGKRVEFELKPDEHLVVSLTETSVTSTQVALIGKSANDKKMKAMWLYHNIVESNSSLAGDSAVAKCIQLQNRLVEKEEHLEHANKEIERLAKRQNRLRENIKTGSGAQQSARWQADLAKAEDRIVAMEEKQLPRLHLEMKTVREELYTALQGLVLEWKE